MEKKPTILVTGGAGYIGSHTLLELIRLGTFDLVSVDNFSNSSTRTFKRIADIVNVEVTNYDIDLTDIDSSRKVFENHSFDGVIHFAAFKSVGESVEKPEKYWHNNIRSLETILELQKEFSVPYHIFSSSCSVYGNIESLPVIESSRLPKAASPYGETKQECERIIKAFCTQNSDFTCLALRYFNPVGADRTGLLGEDPVFGTQNLVPILNQVAIGIRDKLTVHGQDYETEDGTCLRDYVHVTDVAKAHILALEFILGGKSAENYDTFNLGFGHGTSVKELISSFQKVNGVTVNHEYGERRPGDAAAIYADCSKAKKQLNWTPELSLEEMMRSSWIWEQKMKEGI